MHAPAPKEDSIFGNTTRRAAGDQWVWLTSMGLTAGLLMVVAFLALILSQGLTVFWPHKVVRIQLKEGSTAGIGEAKALGGEIAKVQEKRAPRIVKDGEVVKAPIEWQVYVANRDAYGFSYKYVDQDQFERIDEPHGVMEIERLEYGDALGIPIALEDAAGTKTAATDPSFADKLQKAVEEAAKRRRSIENIEKDKIGDINNALLESRLKEKRLTDRNQATPDKLAAIERERGDLQARYEVLAAEAATLREQQGKMLLTYELFTGEHRNVAVGSIVHYYYPNQLTFAGKVGLFFHNLWAFVSQEPREANTEGGIFPAIFGTFAMTLLMSVAVMPFGIIAAIYLREYAVQGPMVRMVRIAVNNLAGVPSIVFGVFGLGFFVYLLGGSIDRLFYPELLPSPTFGTGGIMWASLTLALMTVPVVIVATEEALAAVPRGVREGSLACGASKWQTIQRVVLPASSTGILTGLILAMARGAGEVAPLMLVGVVKLAPSLPIDDNFPFVHLERKFMHLGFHIYDLGFQSPDSDAAIPMVFATTLFLILLVVVLNLTAIIVRERLRRKYATGAF